MTTSHRLTEAERYRRYLLTDLATSLHALKMMRRKGCHDDTWRICWFARVKLAEHMRENLVALGGLAAVW